MDEAAGNNVMRKAQKTQENPINFTSDPKDARFQIRIRDNRSGFPIELVYRKRGWLISRWITIDICSTVEAAMVMYEELKDLPRYLK